MDLDLPVQLESALEAEEAGALNEIIRDRRPEHFEVLRALATGPAIDAPYRTKALYALGRWGDPSVVPEIANTLSELDEGGRIAALDALGRLGTEPAVAAVARSSDDPSPQVRKMAVEALSRIGSPEARQRLEAIGHTDSEAWIRKLAVARAAQLR